MQNLQYSGDDVTHQSSVIVKYTDGLDSGHPREFGRGYPINRPLNRKTIFYIPTLEVKIDNHIFGI